MRILKLLWRARRIIKAIDEIYDLVVTAVEAIEDRRLTQEEAEEIIKKIYAVVREVKG